MAFVDPAVGEGLCDLGPGVEAVERRVGVDRPGGDGEAGGTGPDVEPALGFPEGEQRAGGGAVAAVTGGGRFRCVGGGR